MSRETRPLGLFLSLTVLVWAASACSGSDSDGAFELRAEAASVDGDDAETAESALSVDTIIADSSEVMLEISSVAFEIVHEGVPVFIDPGTDLIAFQAADGRFATPASADALVEVSALGLETEVGAIAVDGQLWITNPLTGLWESGPPGLTLDPAQIFSADVGIGTLLADGLDNPELTSLDPDSDGLYHITAGVDPERVNTLTAGLISGVSDVQIWIDAETYRLARVEFGVETDDGATSWVLALSDYDLDVTIEPPDLG